MNDNELNRRAFLNTLGRCAGGACVACSLGPLAQAALAKPPKKKLTRRVDYFEQLPGNVIECHVCPHRCVLEEGEVGRCRARTNIGGVHYTQAYGNPCILHIDPIEKLPLSHFRPGSKVLTVSTGGCNLRCLYCQNWQQAQKKPQQLKTFDLSPREAVAAARKKNLDTIAFTYTEPMAFLEYARDIAVQAREAGVKIVVGSSVYVNPEPLLDLARYADAFAITLKGFDEDFYEEVCGARLEPVLAGIETLRRKTNCWLELINLIVPTYNDDLDRIREMARWIHDTVGDNMPLHFARFVPMYQLTDLPRTPVPTLEAACKVARDVGLRYVYTSNIAPHESNNTFCDRCGTVLIERLGLKILSNRMRRGRCSKCGNKLPGVWS